MYAVVMADTTTRRRKAASAAVARRDRSSDVGRGAAAPATWGLGDGQAVPWEYAPAPESRDVVSIAPRYGMYIGGKDVPATGGATFTTLDPAAEEPLAEIARADAK